MRPSAAEPHRLQPFPRILRHRKMRLRSSQMRCCRGDCVAFAEKFVNVRCPTTEAGIASGNGKMEIYADTSRPSFANTVNIGK